jgi:oligopeptide/dipeptide ABC transporter ATP-binding protein
MALLEVRDLAVEFSLGNGRAARAVDGITFDVDAGEAVGLVGESGCGKTTTALAITRLLPENGRIAGGSVWFDGVELSALDPDTFRRRRWTDISIIFQGAMNALNPVRRVGDQVAEPILIHEPTLARDAAMTRVGELFEMVGISPERRREYPHQFSGGMRQRVMIAMALACRPRLVIGDEPTTALDVMVQAQILELLERLRRELGLAIILITHDLSVVAETCDRAVVMYAGQLAETGTVSQLHDRPLHPYSVRLLGSVPDISGARVLPEGIPGQPPSPDSPVRGCRFHPRCDHAMAICTAVAPGERGFGITHRVACHAVTVDGRLQAPDELAVLPSASTLATAAAAGAEVPPAEGVGSPEGLPPNPLDDDTAGGGGIP